jgi:hypothetical protein
MFHGILSFGAENNCFIFHFDGFRRISFVFPLAIQSCFVIMVLHDGGDCDYSFFFVVPSDTSWSIVIRR